MKTKTLTIEVESGAYHFLANLLRTNGVPWTESKWMTDD